ncbi:hypothetical protein BJF79_02450 [Actinomadura sp. CNU-125]|nr:hypothetical protein BJF79_02450 [Actinomadura sp. CNU-125]
MQSRGGRVGGFRADEDDPVGAAGAQQEHGEAQTVESRGPARADHQVGTAEAVPERDRAGDDVPGDVRCVENADRSGLTGGHRAGDVRHRLRVAEVPAGDHGRPGVGVGPGRAAAGREAEGPVDGAEREPGRGLLTEQALAP